MKTYITIHGYELVSFLKENGVYHHASIHRLVAMYFVANQYNKTIVNHIDGNKLNNHYTNVEWVTASENNIHAIKLGLYKTHFQTDNPTKGKFGKDARDHKVIEQYSKSGEYITTHYGTNQASRDTGVCVASISRCCTGKAKKNCWKVHMEIQDRCLVVLYTPTNYSRLIWGFLLYKKLTQKTFLI